MADLSPALVVSAGGRHVLAHHCCCVHKQLHMTFSNGTHVRSDDVDLRVFNLDNLDNLDIDNPCCIKTT